MKNVVKVVLIGAALLLAGCTSKPIYNVVEAPIGAAKPNPSMEEISRAIVRAGAGLGWQMTPNQPGHITGRLALRTHVAVVDINYTPKTYSIKYRDSTNLDYTGTSIHRNYNGWIQNLDKAIRAQISAL